MKVSILLFSVLAFSATASADDELDLQWSICDSSPRAVLQKLGQVDASESKDNPITYYDTSPAAYTQLGISFRTKTKKKGLESEVKLRFSADQSSLPKSVACAWDRYGANETYTCSDDDDSAATRAPWSSEQQDFLAPYAQVSWSKLVAFGPYENPKWDITLAGRDATFDTVEANGLHLMEVEIDTTKSQDAAIYPKATAALTGAGVVLCDRQEGKTARLLRALGLLPNQ